MFLAAVLAAALVPEAPNPYEIYEHAAAVWIAAKYPPYVGYSIVVVVNERGVEKSNHYSATYDALHDRVYVKAVSEEERTDPHVPEGINMSIDPKRRFATLFKRRVGNPEEAVDYLGVPELAPNYSFGVARYVPPVEQSAEDRAALVQEIRREFDDPMPAQKTLPADDPSGPKEIVRVVSSRHEYDITYDGIESVDGHQTYHLSLRPTIASNALRLREMWVDTQTYQTYRLLTQRNFTNGTVPWLISFANIGGAPYIVSETALRPVGAGPHLYENAAITFTDIAPVLPKTYLWDAAIPPENVLTEPH
ncbi:MAG: hypothetical protein JO302_05085 [Candidatus Eremiobacteraeota bacterium]|nr:hypothetical protein [Candidatus Eremiobacteraeota bacterium]